MTYQEVLENAKKNLAPRCRVCRECDGRACRGEVPGAGGKGTGAAFIRNVEKLQEITLNLDVLYDNQGQNSTASFWGRRFAAPVFAAPIGGMAPNYTPAMDEAAWTKAVVDGCADAGVLAFTGDGVNPELLELPLEWMKARGGLGVPTIKPWGMETVLEKVEKARAANPPAIAMDVDSAGLPFLAAQGGDAGPKGVKALRQVAQAAGLPFIVKGVMTVEGAKKALEAGAWGDSYPLPINCGGVWSGGGEFLFFCSSGDALYGYRAGEQRLDRLLSWTDVDINSDSLLALSILEDGRLAAVVEESGAETVVLTPADPASLPEKSTVSYATLGLRREVRSAIVAFNKAHPDCRVEVRDYSELNTAGDRTAGLTRLHTEILAGNVPDLLDTAGLPVRQYGRRGLLEDLLPYIRSDPDLGPEALMERVAEAAAQDGKLYQAFPSFTILTAAGRPELVGDRLRWTLADLAPLDEEDKYCILPYFWVPEETLELLLPMLLDSFVDQDAGTASFDGEAFRALLEFCAACPAPEDGESPYARTQEGPHHKRFRFTLTTNGMLIDDDVIDFAEAYGADIPTGPEVTVAAYCALTECAPWVGDLHNLDPEACQMFVKLTDALELKGYEPPEAEQRLYRMCAEALEKGDGDE